MTTVVRTTIDEVSIKASVCTEQRINRITQIENGVVAFFFRLADNTYVNLSR